MVISMIYMIVNVYSLSETREMLFFFKTLKCTACKVRASRSAPSGDVLLGRVQSLFKNNDFSKFFPKWKPDNILSHQLK